MYRRDLLQLGLGLIPSKLASIWTRGAGVTARSPVLLDEARGAARWLRHVAVRADDGLAWPATPGPGATPVANLYSGSAGVVLFFLELQAATGDPADLETAMQGANWLAKRVADERDAGLYTGLAGLGFALAETWRATEDSRYRSAANQVVDRLKTLARRRGDAVSWSDSSDVISGAAGTGFFLLYAARTLGRSDARDLALAAGRHLRGLGMPSDGGTKWAPGIGAPRLYPNFSHGTAGIACFLAALAEATGDRASLAAAVSGARYLQAVADTTDDGCLVFHHEPEPDGHDLYYLSWCHGPAGTARLFERLAVVTRDPSWRTWVDRGARGIVRLGAPGRESPGFWNNVGPCCGVAGVGEFFLAYHERTQHPAALATAREAAGIVMARATRDDTGTRWVHAEHRVQPDNLAAQTGWMQGAAGMAGWLLRMDAFESGRRERIHWPDQ
ncbi:MAG: lanthionine synthetase LanC family protein [Vicinamibacterales bacterium]